jgi:tRNA pseudouridine38-40 synthase
VPRKIRLTLSYDGTDFYGWQIQPGIPTIQGELQRVLAEIEGHAVHLEGSGRTDAGVHAAGQVASLELDNPIPTDNLRRALNRLLPPAIRVLSAEEAPPDFHARFSARSKLYEYRIWRAEVCPPMLYRYVYHHPYPLHVGGMQTAARLFEGTRDFRALAGADETVAPEQLAKPRTIFSSRLEEQLELVVYRVCGSGFLRHMVRNIVGTLLEVGKGNVAPEDVPGLLESGDRRRMGPTAPARGLTLMQVGY